MKSTLIDTALLLLYFFLVFLISRILDIITWYHSDSLSTQTVDPFLLTVRQLKYFLEFRGISYAGYVEKKELVQLLEDTAPVLQGEVDEVNLHDSPDKDGSSKEHGLAASQSSSYFMGGSHFYEQVEDTKDSVWLLQVVPAAGNQNEPLFDDYNWRAICNHLAPFAIRTGILDCKLDRRLCNDKGWHEPLVMLALPKGIKSKDKVVIKTFHSKKPQAVMQWVRKELSVRVETIESLEEVESNWLQETSTNISSIISSALSNKQVKVLLLTHLLQPPLFLAALSIKFTGRIKFGLFTVKKEDSEQVRKRLKLSDNKIPTYIVLTPEKKVFYGRKRFEHFNFKSMNIFLKSIQPEMNDIFLSTMILLNMFIVFQSLRTIWFSPRWKDIGLCFWTLITRNFWLFGIWLMILAACTFSFINFMINMFLICIRSVALTDFGCLLRCDFQMLYYHPYIFFISFFAYCCVVVLLQCKYCVVQIQNETRTTSRTWPEILSMDSYVDNFLHEIDPLTRPSSRNSDALFEESQFIIERLAIPNFWLRPIIPNDYVKDLPFWRFDNWKSYNLCTEAKSNVADDSPEMVQHMMDAKNSFCYRKCENLCRCSVSQNTKDRLTHCDSNSGQQGKSCRKFFKCFGRKAKHLLSGNTSGHDIPVLLNSDVTMRKSDANENVSSCCSSEPFSSNTHCDFKSNSSNTDQSDDGRNTSMSEESEDDSPKPPRGMLVVYECAICLENYRKYSLLCGLPCGHNFHQECIMTWLNRDNHKCPICRWPAYKIRGEYTHPHLD